MAHWLLFGDYAAVKAEGRASPGLPASKEAKYKHSRDRLTHFPAKVPVDWRERWCLI